MRLSLKKHAPLIAALTLPVLATLFVALTVYVPGLFAQPKYDFLYSVGGDYGSYGVNQGKLQVNSYEFAEVNPGVLYVYDMSAGQSRQISQEEARALELSGDTKSPDGFEIVSDHGSSEWLLNRKGEWFVRGHNISKKLDLQTGSYGELNFIGWIQQ